MRRSVMVMLGACAIVAASAGEARAQMTMGTFKGYLTGHIGAVTGGDVTSERMAAGGSIAVHENDGMGAELDFGRATDVSVGAQQLDLTTYFVNAIWAKPAGLVRPFASVGAGLLQVDGCATPCGADPRTFDVGISGGGGAFIALHDAVAIRGDIRYFFSGADHPELGRPGNLGFWRMSIGATFMWAILP